MSSARSLVQFSRNHDQVCRGWPCACPVKGDHKGRPYKGDVNLREAVLACQRNGRFLQGCGHGRGPVKL